MHNNGTDTFSNRKPFEEVDRAIYLGRALPIYVNPNLGIRKHGSATLPIVKKL